jgi:cysteine-rich repeat protein
LSIQPLTNRCRGSRSVRTFALHAFAVAAAVMLTLAAPHRAAALVCGDGVLDPLEECDDGNLLPGDCCSPLCQFEPAGTECRPSTGPCDPAEFCTGQAGSCPNDLNVPDQDGDGVCDPNDDCPAIPDPLQVDTDQDGIGDVCDPCTTVAGVDIERAKVVLWKLGDPPGDERIKIRGSANIDAMPPLNPAKNGLLIQLVDGLGGVTIDVTLPAVNLDRTTKVGWRHRGSNSWQYKGGTNDPPGGIQRVILKQDPNESGLVRFAISGRNGTYASPAAALVTLSLGFAGSVASAGQCPQIQYADGGVGPHCLYVDSATRFVCR